jgi:hypothetical protein
MFFDSFSSNILLLVLWNFLWDIIFFSLVIGCSHNWMMCFLLCHFLVQIYSKYLLLCHLYQSFMFFLMSFILIWVSRVKRFRVYYWPSQDCDPNPYKRQWVHVFLQMGQSLMEQWWVEAEVPWVTNSLSYKSNNDKIWGISNSYPYTC